ncbi:MAG: GNAT family N-acetyltransferase [Chloroflexota bacterium]
MKLKIRRMIRADKPALMAILRKTPEFKPFEVVVAEELIDSYLEDPSGSGYHSLVADIDGAVVGYICYGPTPVTEGTWDVYWQAVTWERQGQGIGGALMTSALKNVREAGGRLAVIETSGIPSYEKTRRYYAGLGYQTVARIPDFYAPGDDKLILVKRLK